MTIIFNDTLGAYGGGQTLILRMCIWLTENGYKTIIFCNATSNTEIVDKLKNIHTTIECFDLHNPKTMCERIQYYMGQDEIRIISLSWNYYLDVEVAKKLYNLKFNNFLYVIHHATFRKGSGFHFKFLKQYSIKKYSRIFEKMNQNNAILMMDEVYLEEGERYLGVHLDPKPTIIRLPVQCEEIDNYSSIIKNGFDSKIIMTASRAEFPFKAYMFGLIDDFVKLKKKYSELKLEIVSDGNEIENLINKMKTVPNNIRKDLIYHRWLDYETLKKEIEKCYVYIGTGTSVVDAALRYKPSIPVVYGIYEDYAECLLSEKPEAIFPPLDCTNPARNVLDRVLSFNEEQYTQECERSYSFSKLVYDLKNVMPLMLSCENTDIKSILTKKQCCRHIWNNRLNRIRYRTNQFDYKKITVEK